MMRGYVNEKKDLEKKKKLNKFHVTDDSFVNSRSKSHRENVGDV